MASTYTNRLGLEKQGDGENPNSWGTILNTNVIDLIDDAIAGYEVVSVSSTGITLSNNNGSTDQSRNAALEFAGTLTANVTITIPSEEKTYFIRENTTGSFAVQMKTAAGSAITLEQQNNIFVACNGTDIYELAVPTSVSAFTANTLTADTITATGIIANRLTGTITVSTSRLIATSIETSVIDASSITVTGNVSAAEYYGDGSNLSGISTDSIPSGAVLPYAGTTAPSGYLLCYGQAISRSTYSDLFSAIGTTYGTGNGSTTFNLPDLRGRVVAGLDDMGGSSANRLTGQQGGVNGDILGRTGGNEQHQLTEAELATHTHGAGSYQGSIPTSGIPEETGSIFSRNVDTEPTGFTSFSVNGSSGSTGSDSKHNNVQPTLILNYVIKT